MKLFRPLPLRGKGPEKCKVLPFQGVPWRNTPGVCGGILRHPFGALAPTQSNAPNHGTRFQAGD